MINDWHASFWGRLVNNLYYSDGLYFVCQYSLYNTKYPCVCVQGNWIILLNTWLGKENLVYEADRILAFLGQIDELQIHMLSEINQPSRTNPTRFLLYMGSSFKCIDVRVETWLREERGTSKWGEKGRMWTNTHEMKAGRGWRRWV